MEELVEVVCDFLIEAIQLGSFVVLDFGVRPCKVGVSRQ